jgi:atypical dual specificity phosphatase
LWDAGVRTVISLINIPQHKKVYEDAGFAYLSSPVLDGDPPTFDQMGRIINFYRASPSAVAVHCHAGLGRTGTAVAACLMSEGHYVRDAIRIVRGARPGTIETSSQSSFLHEFQRYLDED